jgi:undecaprenyl-phosphate glucose phosphotransferase
MTKRIEFDLEYLRRWSLWLDVQILFRTALMVLNDKRAY